jgi:hypothetical protein
VKFTVGAMIGLPVTFLIILMFAKMIFLPPAWLESEFGMSVRWIRRAAATCITITLIIFTCAWWPFDWTYHTWTTVDGQVASVDKRILGQDKGMSEVFLITYRDNPQQYRCDDTRCAGIHPGDQLTLSCKPEWQYAATDGWSCNFVEAKP